MDLCSRPGVVSRVLALAGFVLLGGFGCTNQGGLTACVPGGCPKGSSCIVGRCRPDGAVPARSQSRRVVIDSADVAVLTENAEGADDDTIPLGRRAAGDAVVLLRFELDFAPGDEVEGAFVVLEPTAGARPPNGLVPLEVASIQSPWKSQSASWGRQPKLSLPTDAGFAKAGPPSPLRIDVTHLVRDWPEGSTDAHGIALLAEGDDPLGAIYARGATGGRAPRLEVYLK